jgi:hypothetical protein
MRGLVVAGLVVTALAGCGGDAATPAADAPLCSPRSTEQPCSRARLEVDYRVRIHTHCGVHSAYLDGRWWRVEPAQPEGANWLAGTARLLSDDALDFRSDDGRRYAFAPASPRFRPPPCY